MAKKKPFNSSRSSKSNKRVPIPLEVRNEVLRKCRRHCCMCFGLRDVKEIADGQLAHLDQDNTNPVEDNVAYLCLECHKNYDRRSNRVLNYTAEEIKVYRAKLYKAIAQDHVEWVLRVRTSRDNYRTVKSVVDAVHGEILKVTSDVMLTEGPGAPNG